MTTAHAVSHDYRLHLIAHETRAAHTIEHAHASAVASIMPHVTALLAEYERDHTQRRQDDAQATVPLYWLYEHRRLDALLALILAHLRSYSAIAQAAITHLLHQAAQFGSQSALAQLDAVGKTNVTPAQVVLLARRVSDASEQVANRVAGFAHETTQKVKATLLVGISLGQSVKAIGKRIVQVLDGPRWMARALARTLGWDTYRGVQTDVWTENDAPDWIWRAQPGACKFCLSMDGSQHPASEDMETHGNCRCDKELVAA